MSLMIKFINDPYKFVLFFKKSFFFKFSTVGAATLTVGAFERSIATCFVACNFAY